MALHSRNLYPEGAENGLPYAIPCRILTSECAVVITNQSELQSMNRIAYILVIIGALNWGLVGLGGFADTNLNVVNLILGSMPMLEWIVYVLVGASAVVLLVNKRG